WYDEFLSLGVAQGKQAGQKSTSSAKNSRKSSVKASPKADVDEDRESAEVFPAWMDRDFERSKKASQTVAAKRGKSLKVFKGLDMKGI
ncbi:MAG: hypothetical protein AABZ53_10670, partial [Planctomycetota bacterium]